ncbi:MAG: imidazole glycerol phosphate synthase subunit HisH [Prevotella sp.]|nr:imidazole glycerol phosphate synthase subunit HisH [Prevotella sp.]
MQVAIVKYNAGNIRSVINALNRLGVEPLLTDKPEELQTADRVLFPGQGEATTAMAYLKERNLDTVIKKLQQPVLGICIGQQLLCRHSEEGDTDCIGVFDTDVKRFQPQQHEEKIPAMGWQEIKTTGRAANPLLKNLGEHPYVYFLHSYYVPLSPWTIAEGDYILPYSAALCHKNFYATQFHPEKSGEVGEKILQNFLEL